MISLVIVDHPSSGAPDHIELTKIACAIHRGLSDFGAEYNREVSCRFGDQKDLQAGDHTLGLFRDADQPGALGYHSPDGMGKVFPLLDAQDGVDLSSTIDHEAKELAEDLLCDLARSGSDGRFWADEPCDAVEMSTFTIDGIKLSNYVLPSWYSGNGTKFDALGVLKAPLTLDTGGYAQWFDPDKGWQQIVSGEMRSYRKATVGRTKRRQLRHRAAGRITIEG